jgi:hypothetical protein
MRPSGTLAMGEGRRVVAIVADKDAVVGIIEPLQGRPKHRRNDRGFVPGRDQDGHEPRLARSRKTAREGARKAGVNREGAPDRAGEVDQVDEDVVNREQQEARAREQRQLGRDAAEDFRKAHRGERLAEQVLKCRSRSVHNSLPWPRITQTERAEALHN